MTLPLLQAYKAVRQAGKPFEVVFISGDRTEDAFQVFDQLL